MFNFVRITRQCLSVVISERNSTKPNWTTWKILHNMHIVQLYTECKFKTVLKANLSDLQINVEMLPV